MNFPIYIAELNGYLKALQRLCGNAYVFGITHFTPEGLIDDDIKTFFDTWNANNRLSSVDWPEIKYEGRFDITYEELLVDIESMIFQGLLDKRRIGVAQAQDYISRVILEDIQEYYGLVSTAIDEQGVFHPLIRNPKSKLILSCDFFHKDLFFIINIQGIVLLTFFYKKRTLKNARKTDR